MLLHARLKFLLNYDPETGLWTWINDPGRKPQLVGKEAGHLASLDNSRRIMIDRVMYRSSRLAWFYMTGEWPTEEIDHKDRDSSNDEWDNLRLASSHDNKCNTKLNLRNTSGVRGVSWHATRQKWRAEVDRVHLGLFDTKEEAASVRDAYAAKWHGDFAQLNPVQKENHSDP